jgi:hypothetical protein
MTLEDIFFESGPLTGRFADSINDSSLKFAQSEPGGKYENNEIWRHQRGKAGKNA